ncbi:hypothetical protein M0811_08502 [Anaeramoeba ignava]|uniref:START domain-containing protein n=1 Tax=Anaeramoeba ignava TaxID=1746090 RepID=A0A9Q0LKU6_ANAIG|nr:hypothetical protein M0811_08502 [Anaeramoeba ignava]|eukprot:Anaeramoba_ignava/a610044_683.p1 GENE.a610044_683~~a610044_683.p1  ORF type:complete len:247 (-),score=51.86 a610044_683:181-921(-)
MEAKIEIDAPLDTGDVKEKYPDAKILDGEKDKELIEECTTTVKKAMVELLEELKEESLKNYKKVEEKNGITKYVRMNEGIKVVRGHGKIRAKPEEVITTLADIKLKKTWDKSDEYDDGTVLAKVTDWCSISHAKYKGTFFTSARDFVIVGGYTKLPDGSYILACRSLEYKDFPPVKKSVRAKLLNADWHLKARDDDPNSCDAIYISQSDLMGNIPKTFANKVALGQADLIRFLDDYLSKEKEKTKK